MYKADTYYDEEHADSFENIEVFEPEQPPSTDAEKKALHFFDTSISTYSFLTISM